MMITIEEFLLFMGVSRRKGATDMIAVFLIAFVVLLSFGIPIAIGLGGSALAYLLLKPDIELTILAQTTFGGMASFPLLAIPLFMLAGNLMNEGGLTNDLVRFAKLLLWAYPRRTGPCNHRCLRHFRRHLRSRGGNSRGHRHDHDSGHEGSRL